MRPELVNPGNFAVEKIIYDDGDFSVAIGVWQDDQTRRFAMRWNGNDNDGEDKGYPKVFMHPMWFQLPTDITKLISAIIENGNS